MSIRIKDKLKRSVAGATTSLEDVTVLVQEGKEKLKSKLERKEDSFFVSDKRLLRTIFDGPPRTPASSPQALSPQEQKDEIKEPTYEAEISPSSSKTRVDSKDTSDEENSPTTFRRGHRRSNSESGSPKTPLAKAHSSPDVARTQLYSSLPKSVLRANRIASEINLSHSGKELTEVIPSQQTLARSRAMKNYIEEYYWELLAYLQGRTKREKTLKKNLQIDNKLNKFQQESLVREHLKHETTILRSRRLCGRLNDFQLIKRIGKGKFY